MAKIKLNGDTSGYIEISAPAVSGNNTLELGPGTKILTNLDNTFTGVSTFTSGLHVTGGDILLTGGDGRKISFANDGSAHYFKMDDTLNGPIINGYGGIAFETNGPNERLRITSNGKVGIGSEIPNSKLEVWNNSNIEVLRLRDTHFNKYLTIRGGASPNRMVIDSYEGGGGGADIDLASNGSTKVRITSNGKVGINETSPTARLDINHPNTEQGLLVRCRYGNIDTAMVKFDGDPDSNGGDGNVLHIHGGSSRTDSEILHVDSTGVGDIFDIRGDGLTRVYKQLQLEHSSNVAKIIFNEYGANDPKAQIEMDQINGSAGQLIFRTQNSGTLSERMRITSAGDVGIGANNPTSFGPTLQVAGTDPALLLQDTATAVDYFGVNVTSGITQLWYDDAAAFTINTASALSGAGLAERLRISSEGYVTKPNQPSFFSRPAGGYNLSSGVNAPIGGTWQDVHNIGSHFSNGTFTAPVAGTYQITWSVFSQNETTRLDAYILVNGTVVMREEINGYPNTAINKSGSVHGCYYLSANDNVTFGVYTAAGVSIYVNAAPWTYACGFLLG